MKEAHTFEICLQLLQHWNPAWGMLNNAAACIEIAKFFVKITEVEELDNLAMNQQRSTVWLQLHHYFINIDSTSAPFKIQVQELISDISSIRLLFQLYPVAFQPSSFSTLPHYNLFDHLSITQTLRASTRLVVERTTDLAQNGGMVFGNSGYGPLNFRIYALNTLDRTYQPTGNGNMLNLPVGMPAQYLALAHVLHQHFHALQIYPVNQTARMLHWIGEFNDQFIPQFMRHNDIFINLIHLKLILLICCV